MPIILALQGTITVVGTSAETGETMYAKSLRAYGATIGELLDNLTNASVTLADDIFQWSIMTKPEGYLLSDDRWVMTTRHPDIYEVVTSSPSPSDVNNGASLATVESLVQSAVVIRNITVYMGVLKVKQVTGPLPVLDPQPAKDCAEVMNASTLHEMTSYGFTGQQLDDILTECINDGKLPASPYFNPAPSDNGLR